MKSKITWILIADGAQARVLQNTGPGHGLTPVEGLKFEQEPLLAQDIVSDRPGRSFSSVGSGRSAMEPHTDPVQHREAEFVRSLADMLAKRLQHRDFERLVLAMAPSALGDLRPALSADVRKTIIAELPKDLTNTPTPELARHFDGILVL